MPINAYDVDRPVTLGGPPPKSLVRHFQSNVLVVYAGGLFPVLTWGRGVAFFPVGERIVASVLQQQLERQDLGITNLTVEQRVPLWLAPCELGLQLGAVGSLGATPSNLALAGSLLAFMFLLQPVEAHVEGDVLVAPP